MAAIPNDQESEKAVGLLTGFSLRLVTLATAAGKTQGQSEFPLN